VTGRQLREIQRAGENTISSILAVMLVAETMLKQVPRRMREDD
jgi:hypothetical protein